MLLPFVHKMVYKCLGKLSKFNLTVVIDLPAELCSTTSAIDIQHYPHNGKSAAKEPICNEVM